MAIAPVHRLKKSEIVWLGNRKCKHGHTYLEHYNCYLNEHLDKQEKIGFFDIEASNLSADFGIMLCYSIKDGLSDKIYSSQINKKDLQNGDLDKKVVRNCIEDLLKFDKVVTYYGTKFDLPFVRTRATIHGIDFPNFGSLNHRDAYYIVKSKFRLSRNKLVTACDILLGETDKTVIKPDIWLGALQGKQDDIDYIQEHCDYDVLDLEKLYNRIIEYAYPQNRSI